MLIFSVSQLRSYLLYLSLSLSLSLSLFPLTFSFPTFSHFAYIAPSCVYESVIECEFRLVLNRAPFSELYQLGICYGYVTIGLRGRSALLLLSEFS